MLPTGMSTICHHGSGRVEGWLPDDVLADICGSFDPLHTVWISREQSAAIRAHPAFVSASSGLPKGNTPQ